MLLEAKEPEYVIYVNKSLYYGFFTQLSTQPRPIYANVCEMNISSRSSLDFFCSAERQRWRGIKTSFTYSDGENVERTFPFWRLLLARFCYSNHVNILISTDSTYLLKYFIPTLSHTLADGSCPNVVARNEHM
jgi:hypothetical protein